MTNLKLKSPVPFPASVQGAGGIKVSKSAGVWTIEPGFDDIASITASAIADPTSKQIWIFDPVTLDYNVLTLAGLGDALYKTSSTSSLAIGTGSKTFTVDSGKDITVGDWVLATSNADATNFMIGQVSAYSGSSLTISVPSAGVGGSGTKADWTIRISSAAVAGKSAGFSYKWSTDTTSSDPTAGFVKANNATFLSITTLYISETDNDANALSSEIATWTSATSTIKGRIKIYDPVTPTNFMTFDLTALTDSGAYDTLTVTPKASGGSFSASLGLRVSFTPKGDKGDTGPSGNATFSGTTTHGVMVASSLTSATSTAVMSGGQLLVGQTGADPLPQSISGAITVTASGTTSFTDPQLASNIPQNSQSAAYTLVLTDGEKHILHPSADTTARIFTIPANSSVAFPIGTAITFVNQNAGGVITIAITTDTMRIAGAGTTGSRTLAANGIATALKITSTEWIISGTGLS
jgi:hypothetical protein